MPGKKTNSASLGLVYSRLVKLHLNTMADELMKMASNGELYTRPALDILDQLTNLQEISSDNSATDRYKKAAKLYWPMADLADILYIPERHINSAMVDKLRTNEYIKNSLNVLMTSATGCGKTFFACAFGNNACESQYSVRYFTMAELLYSFKVAEDTGKYVKHLNKLANTNLIILDDFLLTSVEQRDVEYLYRLISSKTKRNRPRSFIICSQLMPEEMYTYCLKSRGSHSRTAFPEFITIDFSTAFNPGADSLICSIAELLRMKDAASARSRLIAARQLTVLCHGLLYIFASA